MLFISVLRLCRRTVRKEKCSAGNPGPCRALFEAFQVSCSSVPNRHAEAAAVVAVVVIVDGKKQPAVGGCGKAQLGADEKRLARLAIRKANVADECSGTRRRYRLRTDNGPKARAAPAFRTHFADAASRDDP